MHKMATQRLMGVCVCVHKQKMDVRSESLKRNTQYGYPVGVGDGTRII